MEDKIRQEIARHHDELAKLTTAVEQIENATAISKAVIEAVESVQAKYGEHLDIVLAKYNEYLEKSQTIYQLQVSEVDSILGSHKNQIEEVQSILSGYMNLAQTTTKLNQTIEAVDFPQRLSEVEAAVQEMKQEFENTQMLVMSVEKNLKKELSYLKSNATRNNTDNKMIKTLLIISTVLLAGISFGVFYNFFV